MDFYDYQYFIIIIIINMNLTFGGEHSLSGCSNSSFICSSKILIDFNGMSTPSGEFYAEGPGWLVSWLVGYFVLRRINIFGLFNAELNCRQFSLL